MTKTEEWQERLGRYESSGLSAAEFCREEGVSTASLYSWRRRLPRFVEVALPVASTLFVEVGGARIEVPADFDPSHLRAVVAALR